MTHFISAIPRIRWAIFLAKDKAERSMGGILSMTHFHRRFPEYALWPDQVQRYDGWTLISLRRDMVHSGHWTRHQYELKHKGGMDWSPLIYPWWGSGDTEKSKRYLTRKTVRWNGLIGGLPASLLEGGDPKDVSVISSRWNDIIGGRLSFTMGYPLCPKDGDVIRSQRIKLEGSIRGSYLWLTYPSSWLFTCNLGYSYATSALHMQPADP